MEAVGKPLLLSGRLLLGHAGRLAGKPLLLSGRPLLAERTQWTVSDLVLGFVKIRVNSWTVNPDMEPPGGLGPARMSADIQNHFFGREK